MILCLPQSPNSGGYFCCKVVVFTESYGAPNACTPQNWGAGGRTPLLYNCFVLPLTREANVTD